MTVRTSLSPVDVGEEFLRDARISVDDLRQPPSDLPLPLRWQPRSTEPLISLPAAQKLGRALEPALARRVSVRSYGPEPVSLEALSTALVAATRVDEQHWEESRRLGIELGLLVVAMRVDGLAAGIYRYIPSAHALTAVAVPLTVEQLQSAVMQMEYAYSPLLLLVFGNLAAACDLYGSHGYRQLLTRAGATAHAAYLAAIELGLAGSLFAGLLRNPLRRLANLDGYKEAALFGLSIGPWPSWEGYER